MKAQVLAAYFFVTVAWLFSILLANLAPILGIGAFKALNIVLYSLFMGLVLVGSVLAGLVLEE